MGKQCSDLFGEVFDSHGGGCRRDCDCGRVHFDGSDNGWTWEDGELEELQAKAKEEPDKYVEHDGTVGCMMIGGKEIVYDCTCETAERYERFIIHHAEQLSEYLRRRAAALREEAGKIDVPQVVS